MARQQRPRRGYNARMARDLPIEVVAGSEAPLGMSAEAFLRGYWQRRPLLIRNAFEDFVAPLGGDDLAGLACEPAALSRLVMRDAQAGAFRVEHGPFPEQRFAKLAERDWTLLVEDVDKWDADVAALLKSFRFLPDWRIDDVMVSFAAEGGGVGPHVDQYDVFLLQGQGQRLWRFGARPNLAGALREDCELAVLKEFVPAYEFRLQRGDMLYLPPGVAHEGIACEPGLTFSVGMRAPSRADLLVDLAEHVAERSGEDQRYRDPELDPVADSAEIDAIALTRVRDVLGSAAGLLSPSELAIWFGRFITRYRSAGIAAPLDPPLDHAELAAALLRRRLRRHPMVRIAWLRRGSGAMLFAAGEAYPVSLALARSLTRSGWQEPVTLPDNDCSDALLPLVNAGHLTLELP